MRNKHYQITCDLNGTILKCSAEDEHFLGYKLKTLIHSKRFFLFFPKEAFLSYFQKWKTILNQKKPQIHKKIRLKIKKQKKSLHYAQSYFSLQSS